MAIGREIKVGLFVFLGLVVVGIVVLLIGDERHIFARHITLDTSFSDVQGLKVGAPVRMDGIDVGTISFADGAGGGRGDYTTPRATVQLLRHMITRPDFAFYEAALPVLGVDGMLATSVSPESPARGKVRAKTGTLLWENTMNESFLLTSKALGGYLTTASGRKLVLSIMVNNVPLQKSADSSIVGRTLGQLCEIICDDR